MSFTDPTLADPITPSDAWRQAAARETPFGQYIGEKLLGGLEATRPVQALEQAMLPPRSNIPDEYGFVAPAGPSPVLGKEAWETGPHQRPGLEWDPGMTEARAEALATQKDRLDWNNSLIARYQGGYLGEAAGFVAGLAPGVADPTNYIPLLGPAAKAAMVARLGVIGGNVALHGAEAAANTALFEPLTASHAATFGQPYGWEDAAADVALGALAGSVGGAIHGGLSLSAAKAEYRGSLREAATRTRLETVLAAADATSLAAEQNDRGLPVDVAPILAGRLPAAPPPSTFDVGGIVPRRAGEARPPEAPRPAATELGPALDRYLNPQPDGAGTHGTPLNAFLRDPEAYAEGLRARGWSEERIAARGEVLRGDAAALDAATSPSAAPLTLYRGERPYEGGGVPKVGDVIERPGLLSATTDPRVAETAAMPGVQARPIERPGPRVVYEIGTPAGTRMLDRRGAASNEREVILARGTRLRVEAVERDGETVRVKAEALPPAGGGAVPRRAGEPSFATATPEPPHPSVAEAAGRVGKAEADPLATFKRDAGLEGYQAPLPGHEPKPEPVPGEPARRYHLHGSSGGPMTEVRDTGKFNFFGREGLYVSDNLDLVESYAAGAEAHQAGTVGKEGAVTLVSYTGDRTLHATTPLGDDAARLVAAIKADEKFAGMSDIGRKTIERKLEGVTPESTLQDVAALGADVTSFTGRAVQAIGYDIIKQGPTHILLDKAKARIERNFGLNELYKAAEERDRLNAEAERPSTPAKPERPPTREEKAAALAALPPELAEIEAMKREGSFTPGDEATLAAGEAEAQKAENYAAAWTTLAGCVARAVAP